MCRELMRKKAAEMYAGGKITFSKAAEIAGLTLWEMERFLVDNCFRSAYSAEDLERKLRPLG